MFLSWRRSSLPRAFWRLAGAVASANVADGIRSVAMPLIAVTLTRDPSLIAGLGVAQTLPHLVVGIPSGAVVDRFDRRRTMLAANAAQSVLFLIVFTSIVVDQASVALLYGVAVTLGVTETLRDVAGATALPAIVPPRLLERANARLVAAEFGTQQLLGPVVGSLLFAVALFLPFGLSSLLMVGAAVLVRSLPDLFPGPREGEQGHSAGEAEPRAGKRSTSRNISRVAKEISEGIRFLAQHRVLRATLGLGIVLTLTDTAWFSILVLFVSEKLGMPRGAYGLFLAIGALGGISGGLVADRLIARIGTAAALRVSVAVIGAMQLTIGFTSSVVIAIAGLAIGNVAFAVWHTASAALRQRLTPNHILGRVNGAWRTAFMGVAPVGFVVGGALASAFGLRAPFLAGAPVVLLAAVLASPIASRSIAEP